MHQGEPGARPAEEQPFGCFPPALAISRLHFLLRPVVVVERGAEQMRSLQDRRVPTGRPAQDGFLRPTRSRH